MATKNWESTRLLQWSQVNFTQASRTQWSKYLPIRKGPDSDRLWGLADSQHCPHLGFGHELVHGAQGGLQLRVWADPPYLRKLNIKFPFPQLEVWTRAGRLAYSDFVQQLQAGSPAFLITRHPFARIVSAYKNKIENRTKFRDGNHFYNNWSREIIKCVHLDNCHKF